MAHIELQITAADPPYFVLEPLGVQLAIQEGDTLSVHLESDIEGNPEVDRSLGTLTVYMWTGCTVRIAINGHEAYRCDVPMPPLPGGMSAVQFLNWMDGAPTADVSKRTPPETLPTAAAPPPASPPAQTTPPPATPPPPAPQSDAYICRFCSEPNEFSWAACKACGQPPPQSHPEEPDAPPLPAAGSHWIGLGNLALSFELLLVTELLIYGLFHNVVAVLGGAVIGSSLFYCVRRAKRHPHGFLAASYLNVALLLLALFLGQPVFAVTALVAVGVLLKAYAQAQRQAARHR